MSQPGTLKAFCMMAILHATDCHPSNFVSVFIYYRYERLSREFPHSAFGTNRTTEFFEDTMRFLNDPEGLNKALTIATKEQQTYEIAYLKWVKSYSEDNK